MSELKPCPRRCERQPWLFGNTTDGFFVRCRVCQTSGPLCAHGNEAIVEWNALSDRRASPWMPIETAPKDGTMVLLYLPAFEPMQAFFVEDSGRWFVGARSIIGRQIPSYCPTHWMPLPAPPEAP